MATRRTHPVAATAAPARTVVLELLIEDNASDEELARLAFARCSVPCVLVVARDGAEALDCVFSTGKFHDCDPMGEPAMVGGRSRCRGSALDVLRRIRAAPETRAPAGDRPERIGPG